VDESSEIIPILKVKIFIYLPGIIYETLSQNSYLVHPVFIIQFKSTGTTAKLFSKQH